jgi:hypothetical protein
MLARIVEHCNIHVLFFLAESTIILGENFSKLQGKGIDSTVSQEVNCSIVALTLGIVNPSLYKPLL